MGRNKPKPDSAAVRPDFFSPRPSGNPSSLAGDGTPTQSSVIPPADPSQLTTGERILLDAMEALRKKSERVETKVVSLESSMEAVTSRLSGIEAKLTNVSERLSTQEASISELQSFRAEATTNLSALAKGQVRLEKRAEAAENLLRECNIRILGIPADAEGTEPAAFVSSLLQEILAIDPDKDPFYIVKAYRLPTRRPNVGGVSSGTMMTVLGDVGERDVLLNMARKKKELRYRDNRILLFPDISPISQDRKVHLLEIRKKLAALQVEASVVYPAKLRARYKDKSYVFQEVDSAAAFLDKVTREAKDRGT